MHICQRSSRPRAGVTAWPPPRCRAHQRLLLRPHSRQLLLHLVEQALVLGLLARPLLLRGRVGGGNARSKQVLV